ncbi:hypothetical protein PISMIDRAFT_678609 [Pisolithus microcarpus 441]|uniref:Uncharacterized protein n=1 Tax=Pisolithus microcarpus 441 TaxID=765257 RepID=A0A0C9ZP50_9AGAM|nr:hypothetical protein PISMIDRAFT_678609 [Pisolithus microcarpus 441]
MGLIESRGFDRNAAGYSGRPPRSMTEWHRSGRSQNGAWVVLVSSHQGRMGDAHGRSLVPIEYTEVAPAPTGTRP